jgi:tRNA pseudouridine38-40 synthase
MTTIQYDGTNYFGFQWQKDIPTIQNDFNNSVAQLIDGKITTMSASRTDTGVHAFEQVVKITSEREIDCTTFVKELNLILPSQIRCLNIIPCKGSFRPANDGLSKEYRYFFTNILKKECTDEKFIANNFYPLNIEAMKVCARMIEGKHDFKNFYSAGSNVKSTIRVISSSELTEVNPHEIFQGTEIFRIPDEMKSCYQLRIIGNGFLKQMIRHLMSALWLVGNGRLTTEDFSNLLLGPQKTKRMWKVASPRGLYLYQIIYKENVI